MDYNNIAEELFDFSEVGIIAMPNAVNSKLCAEAVKIAKKYDHLFKIADPVVDNGKNAVYQDMRTLYLQTAQHKDLEKDLEEILQIADHHYKSLLKQMNIKGSFNLVGMHHYKKNSKGISYHRDFKADQYFLMNIVLSGNNPQHGAMNRAGKNEKEFPTKAGTITWMRMARNEDEQKYRAWHVLKGPIVKERYNMIFRRDSKNSWDSKPYT